MFVYKISNPCAKRIFHGIKCFRINSVLKHSNDDLVSKEKLSNVIIIKYELNIFFVCFQSMGLQNN